MKYIKKYNEDLIYFDEYPRRKVFNIEDHIDIDYISGCFSNLIDEADIDYELDEDDNTIKKTYELVFYTDDVINYRNGNIERINTALEHITNVKDLLEEIKSSIQKVQIEYPGLVPYLDIEYQSIINNRAVNAFSDLHPITCIAIRYNHDTVEKYLKSK